MKNIAPDIFRQRLLLEGLYTIHIDRQSFILSLILQKLFNFDRS